jgi:hypothetical protein
MLAEMDPGTSAAALRRLPSSHVATILAGMPPDRAAPIAARLGLPGGAPPRAATDGGVRPRAVPASRPAKPEKEKRSHAADAG